MGAVGAFEREAVPELPADEMHFVAQFSQYHAGAVHAVVGAEIVGYADEGEGHTGAKVGRKPQQRLSYWIFLF